LYIGTEWHRCRPSPLVLELWQGQERLDQNIAWMERIFCFGVYFLLVSDDFKKVFTFFTNSSQYIFFFCLACIKMRVHEKSSYLLGYNAWKSADVSEKRVEEYAMYPLLCHCFSLGLLVCPEDGVMFLWNIRWRSTDFMALYPRR
jgi:hypothetical protein